MLLFLVFQVLANKLENPEEICIYAPCLVPIYQFVSLHALPSAGLPSAQDIPTCSLSPHNVPSQPSTRAAKQQRLGLKKMPKKMCGIFNNNKYKILYV